MRLLTALLVLVVLGFAALSGYAYFGEYTPDASTVTQPIVLPGPDDAN